MLPVLFFILPGSCFALMTELGLSYSYQKKTFNASNYYQTDSKSASLSIYLIEQLAIELSYTDSFYESQEEDASSTRTVQQSSKISGTDLVYIITDQRAAIQPYLKAGAAYIVKKKQIRYLNTDVIDIPTKDGVAPSYGIGIKLKLKEGLSMTFGYDVWNTPLDDGTKTDDTAFKAGLKWML